LKNEKYRVLVVLRSDNTALYATEDLALAIKKFEDYPDLVRSLYMCGCAPVAALSAGLQDARTGRLPWADRCQHVPYELVNLPGNVVMASREGTVVLLRRPGA
jgi:arginyl-tRNA synthetase